MTRSKSKALQDLALRALGLALIGAGAAALAVLAHIGQGEGVLRTFVGAAAFVGMSFGIGLLCLGGHIHDEVELSARWSRRDPFGPPYDHDPAARPRGDEDALLRAVPVAANDAASRPAAVIALVR